ncbi:MAG: hypothetical protein MJ087_06620 [Lachnospiraceae bacterium]|nr:hypothetical protein [Lachnospiraceae bacterium]
MDYKKGYFATSKAGHDKGKCYIVAYADEMYVYLVNGVTKKLEAPKKKKKMHIQIQCCIDEELELKLKDDCKISNEDIKNALERHLK